MAVHKANRHRKILKSHRKADATQLLVCITLGRASPVALSHAKTLALTANAKSSSSGPLLTLMQAGYVINLKKSDLMPVQHLVYIGGRFQTDLVQIFLTDTRKDTLISCVRMFCKAGCYKPANQFLRLLGLMAATLLVMPHAHLCMRPVQWYL